MDIYNFFLTNKRVYFILFIYFDYKLTCYIVNILKRSNKNKMINVFKSFKLQA